MRALFGWQAWLFAFYLLSSTAFAGEFGMAAKVSLTGLPNEPRLLINLKNEGPQAISFYKWRLPWVESHSLLVAAVREDGVSLKKALMFDDGDKEVVSLGPGKSVEGTVPLSLYFPDLDRDLKQTGVIIFWTYQMVLKDGSKLERSGGWLSIPRSPQPLPRSSDP